MKFNCLKTTLSRLSIPAVLAMICAIAIADSSFLGALNHIRSHGTTVPANGDVNPYGVAVVPETVTMTEAKGRDDDDHGDDSDSEGGDDGGMMMLQPNHVLVSNFNNSKNLQGTGTTIVQTSPGLGQSSLFAQIDPARLPGPCPGGVGLTTALVVLRSGWVVAGSLPTTDGTAATAKGGCLILLDHHGNAVATFADPSINGPWDMTAEDNGSTAVLFVTNVMNGTVAANGGTVSNGTVLRIEMSTPKVGGKEMPKITSLTVIGDGFPQRTDAAALVIGPTGVALARDGTLYVADTLGNRIAAIPNALHRTNSAGTGKTVSGGGALNGPLGLAMAPNGDILTVNGGDGNMVEITPSGNQVAVKMVDVTKTGAGTLFGLAVRPNGQGVYFVNDGNNTLNLVER